MRWTRWAGVLWLVMSSSARADEPRPMEWFDDVTLARERAAETSRLVMVREVVCECDGRDCPDFERASSPWFLEDPALRMRVAKHFVGLRRHCRPAEAGQPFFDPGFPESRLLKMGMLRTLFATPSGRLIHRLDLCPYSRDIASEIDFVLRIRAECFRADGVIMVHGELRMALLQRDHDLKPLAYHPAGAIRIEEGRFRKRPRAASRAPWRAYGSGIAWTPDLAEAQRQAKGKDRLLFLFQVVGDLDKDGC